MSPHTVRVKKKQSSPTGS